MTIREDSELLEWLERVRRFNPERFEELRLQIGKLARSEEAVALVFSAVHCMLSNFSELPSALPSA